MTRRHRSDPALKLDLSEQEMRELGYHVIDTLVAHLTSLPDQPVTKVSSRKALDAVLQELPPESGADPQALIAFLRDQVFSQSMVTNHPRFFAFVPSPSNFVSVMGDALISGFNSILAEWAEASGPATLELVTVDWLRRLCGLPESAGGIFVSGGSAANLTALAVAREIKLNNVLKDARVYCSEQTHASNRKALKILGFLPDQIMRIPVDGDWRLDCAALLKQISRDRAEGYRPFCVIANAGTTSTGAVDPLKELIEIGKAQDIWIHIDGAYGAAAVITERGQKALQGLGDADSLAIDPHKWLFQPFEIGCVLLKDFTHLTQTFGEDHVYLKDVEGDPKSGEINLCNAGIQLTRNFRALKLWFSLKTFGLESFRTAMDHTIDLAVRAEQIISKMENVEICTSARLGIVTFRFTFDGWSVEQANVFNAAIVQWVIKDGRAMLSSTRLGEKTVLRLCTINPRTTEDDLQLTKDVLVEAAKDLRASDFR